MSSVKDYTTPIESPAEECKIVTKLIDSIPKENLQAFIVKVTMAMHHSASTSGLLFVI